MRDLHLSELDFVYGAGGGGRDCKPSPCSKGESKKHSKDNCHESRGHSHHSRRCH